MLSLCLLAVRPGCRKLDDAAAGRSLRVLCLRARFVFRVATVRLRDAVHTGQCAVCCELRRHAVTLVIPRRLNGLLTCWAVPCGPSLRCRRRGHVADGRCPFRQRCSITDQSYVGISFFWMTIWTLTTCCLFATIPNA